MNDKKREKTIELLNKFRAYLEEHGESKSKTVAEYLGLSSEQFYVLCASATFNFLIYEDKGRVGILKK